MIRLLLVILLLLAGCSVPPSDTVSRYIDQDYGVVCWTYQSGISCVPLKDTTQAR